MTKPLEEESGTLEITSIGTLHKGPWDKKYWSSSRGKDRYPYPVGYQALRTHNGIRYKMEIHEGPRGPSFVIISADGISCSGQTPDIAWDTFQKKGCPHVKRLSWKIDGVEFFGFRNPFVQRLLRELVVNVNRSSEQSLASASFCIRASGVENKTRPPDSFSYPDWQPYLETPQTTSKRSRKLEDINMKSVSVSAHKRFRHRELINNSVASSSSLRNHNVKNGFPLETVGLSDHLREDVLIHQEEGNLVSFENDISTGAVNVLSIDEKPLDRSKHMKLQGLGCSKPAEYENGETTFPIIYQGFGNIDHCAADTLDHIQDCASAYASTLHKEAPDNVKDELIAADVPIFEASETECNLEEEMGVHNSNGSSERSDLNSVGQEIAKSMMTVLLPQALPLLKKTSSKKKKKAANNQLEFLFCRAESLGEKTGANPTVNVASHAPVLSENSLVKLEGKVQMFSGDFDPIIPSFERVKSVILDSPDDDHCGHDSAYGPLFFSDIAGADQTSFNKDMCTSDTLGLGNTHAHEPSFCHIDPSESKDVFLCSKANVVSELDENYIHHRIVSKEGEKTFLDCAGDTSSASSKCMVSSVQISEQKIACKVNGGEAGNQILDVASLTRNYNSLLSESIIYRNLGDDCILDAYPTADPLLATEICQVSSPASSPDKKVLFSPKVKLEGQLCNSTAEEIALCSEDFSQVHIDEKILEPQNLILLNRSFQKGGTSFCENNMFNAEEVDVGTNSKDHIKMEFKNVVGNTELVGCYGHPMPVLSVLLNTREDEIHICVLCGLSTDKDTILFLYKVRIKEPRVQSPTFIGYVTIMSPTLKDRNSGQILLDRYGLQFTPDGQSLVLMNSIKTSYCRKQKILCLCSACKLECLEENAIKIVQVKLGYLSVLAKLKTDDSIQCMLVCEPNHLVAVEECGRLHVWVMNPTWSLQTEDYVIPTHDHEYPCIIQLKRIPRCSPFVVGHHGFGEFSLWDISQRILISMFTVPSISFFNFIPIRLFSFWSAVPLSRDADLDLQIDRIMAATEIWFSKHNKKDTFLPFEGESIAVWLLVSTLSDSDTQRDDQMNDCPTTPVRSWRLALLVKNMVILGGALDPRAAAIGASAGHGIIGTHDGLVYMWELSTGTKLGNLHNFKGGASCIATDDSGSEVFAVAGGGQLLVYLQSNPQKES